MAVKEYIDEMTAKGFLRTSTSRYASPVLVVKKPGGGLRVCVDYRAINAITKRNRNAPPSLKDTLARMNKTKFMSIMDVIAGFNNIRVKEGDEEKTAFLTRYGLYEYTVMPFGLTGAPGTFQTYINETLRQHLDDFCTAYLDDVLVYSETEEDHIEHVRAVVDKLGQAGLYLNMDKCQFKVKKVKYLGIILTTEGIEMDPNKVQAVHDWQLPRSLKDVQAFLSFANFYRQFIKGFSQIARPLTNLTKGDAPKDWPVKPDPPTATAFDALKQAFATAPVLVHFDPDKETWLETDASDFVTAAVLSQKDDQDILRPIAYLSHKMNPAECNYEIYDKELLAIVRAFEEWRSELSGTRDPINVVTDHLALQYFMTSKRLNRRQARWAEFLAEFNFRIRYRPGKQGTKPDALTRRPGDLPEGNDDARRQHQVQTVLRPEIFEGEGSHYAVAAACALLDESCRSGLQLAAMLYHIAELAANDNNPIATTITETNETAQLLKDIETAYAADETVQDIIAAVRAKARRLPEKLLKLGLRIEVASCRLNKGLLYIKDRLYVPDDEELYTRILKQAHDSVTAGHVGREGTYKRVSRWYYWPRMTHTIACYVRACVSCRRSKPYRDAKHGLLHPLLILDCYWKSILMDFIVGLPPCYDNGKVYTAIMVVVDWLSKKKKFIPMVEITAEAVTEAFITYVWREEGFPEDAISDRGRQFISHFWKRLCERLGTKPRLSTSWHPETDGQTEVANATLKEYLRAYVNYQQDDWALYLPMAEFVANSSVSDSTGVAPFVATKGYLPRDGTEPAPSRDVESASGDAAATSERPITAPARMDRQRADDFVNSLTRMRDFLRDNLQWAQAKQAEYADAKRAPAPFFKVGDKVMLDARNLKTKRPSSSLDYKNRGPFRVVRVINDMAYELDLPKEMGRLHNVFHPWLLHPYDEQPLNGQAHDKDDVPLDERTNEEYEVKTVLTCRLNKLKKDPYVPDRSVMEYKVLWDGFEEPTWEPYYNLLNCPRLVAGFHAKNLKKPAMPHNFDELVARQDVVACLAALLVADARPDAWRWSDMGLELMIYSSPPRNPPSGDALGEVAHPDSCGGDPGGAHGNDVGHDDDSGHGEDSGHGDDKTIPMDVDELTSVHGDLVGSHSGFV